ncbi:MULTISPECIES: TRAP transporter large permease [unclassified Maritimibacter]|uniref:TRAP transporter large permease n=1 Tax=unclassified Maritimibacter TaxID=2635563 RepID=UPI000C0B7C9F|nr:MULTISPECIES: TRAP transporter large permease [unclassified Maritimibacter]MAM61395.1 C4-dicarboxylate ABC transporter permease [Maritimibacter sp.]MBL6430291.1 TRAP transporter large permease [Maritimibacter sp.]
MSRVFVGHRRGGLAVSAILACAGFAAINGSSLATAATMTKIAMPEMRREGYEASFAAGSIAAGGTLGIIIPPSVAMLVYAILTEQDVATLFIAGILPGLLAVALYSCAIWIVSFRRPEAFPVAQRTERRERMRALRDVWATLLLFSLVFGSMYLGIVTVAEAAALGAVGTMIIGVLRGRLDFPAIRECLIEALRTTASIFTIAIGAFLFGYFLAITRTTQNLTGFIIALDMAPAMIMALLLLGYLLLGAFVDEIAIVLLTIPIVYPAVIAMGFDPIWFGVIIVMTVSIGLISPPVGMNVYVINSIDREIGLVGIFKGVMPFLAADLVRLLLLSIFPAFSLLLPSLMP